MSALQMSASNGQKPELPDDENEERDRRATNIFLLVAAIVFIAAGTWLVDAMIAAKKADDCMSSGRRNCAPIDVPTR